MLESWEKNTLLETTECNFFGLFYILASFIVAEEVGFHS